MTNTASTQTGNFWDFAAPQPTQDADLLKQLNFLPGFKELLMVRQVHALEHATVWVLDQRQATSPSDNNSLGGLSTDEGFYLYGQVNTTDLKRAVPTALSRLKTGEWDLAVHPRCGTNLSVGMFLTAGLAIGAHLLLPRSPLEQMLGIGIAAATATQLTPDLGTLAQRHLTTSIPFNLAITDISATSDLWGRAAHFVQVRWQD
ncbi:MAG: DUF6391 domain-containing protein [Coleofasciculaceae cyanobacterium]